MTNVPGAGFVALLAVMVVFVVLPLLASASLLVARSTGLRIEWSLLAVHAVGLVGGVIVLSVTGPFGIESPSLPAVVGLLRFAAGVLLAGLAIAGVAEGGPIAAGAAIAVLIGDVPWRRGVWYATVGYAGGGVAGALVGVALTGRLEVAAVGAVLAAPAALCGLAFERAAVRAGRFSSVA
jgi:hypothetical protein